MKKILVVNDEQDVLTILKSFLTGNNYTVSVTQTCEEAMAIFNSLLPDLVLLDINVGDSDGREVCRQIKSRAEHAHIPVILISANRQALSTFTQYGANAAIEKPFSFDKLLEVINAHL